MRLGTCHRHEDLSRAPGHSRLSGARCHTAKSGHTIAGIELQNVLGSEHMVVVTLWCSLHVPVRSTGQAKEMPVGGSNEAQERVC